MKFKFKELILGIVIGAIVFSNISISADTIYNIISNTFKIEVNGVEKKIEGYNINGSTYFKLRDIGKETGFNVDFKEGIIMIDTNKDVINNINNENYYPLFVLNDKILINTFISREIINNTAKFYLINKTTKEILIEEIPYITVDSMVGISKDYYNNTILPLDESLN